MEDKIIFWTVATISLIMAPVYTENYLASVKLKKVSLKWKTKKKQGRERVDFISFS